MSIKILAFDGSGRDNSFNRKLLKAGLDYYDQDGVEIELINLLDYDMPIYDGDLEREEGIPDAAIKLKKLMDMCAGYLIAAPDYNGGLSGLLKNAIDWVSRKAEGESPLQQFRGKTAAIMSASPGRLGGMRGLIKLNTVLWGLGVYVLPQIVSLPNYGDSFEGDKLTDEQHKNALQTQAKALIKITKGIKS